MHIFGIIAISGHMKTPSLFIFIFIFYFYNLELCEDSLQIQGWVNNNRLIIMYLGWTIPLMNVSSFVRWELFLNWNWG